MCDSLPKKIKNNTTDGSGGKTLYNIKRLIRLISTELLVWLLLTLQSGAHILHALYCSAKESIQPTIVKV